VGQALDRSLVAADLLLVVRPLVEVVVAARSLVVVAAVVAARSLVEAVAAKEAVRLAVRLRY
jgi:hypothetical protein